MRVFATTPDEPGTTQEAPRTSTSAARTIRWRRWWPSRLTAATAAYRERGMSTAEYAVGTIAACAFAALLFKVVSSPEVQEMLSSLIDRALKTGG
ncbi:DUF4244 domain-containing protein [Nonomuraea sp. NPDC048916]|uniref:DUF4244 domain-containing protein n=1 Tax=Nonomuraea sp. NPDC048916 TaxID=3154232 RepID=UPI0034002C9F